MHHLMAKRRMIVPASSWLSTFSRLGLKTSDQITLSSANTASSSRTPPIARLQPTLGRRSPNCHERTVRRPERRLLFQGRDDRGIIEHVHRRIERAQAGLVGEQLREGNFAFARLRKLRPELGDAMLQLQTAFLQKVKQTRMESNLIRSASTLIASTMRTGWMR